MTNTPSRISTCFWFDRDGEQAAELYVKLIPNSRLLHISRYGDGSPFPPGTAMMVALELDGIPYSFLNGGPVYQKSAAASLIVMCDSQAEIDRLWDALCADGGRPVQCGWLTDRFGMSWQIVPSVLPKLMTGPDPDASGRVMGAMMGMVKLDIAGLEAAFHNQ